jgi:hypothetical protein
MSEQREPYKLDSEPEQAAPDPIMQDVHRDLIRGLVDTIVAYPDWFAGLLEEHQAQKITQAIKIRYPGL